MNRLDIHCLSFALFILALAASGCGGGLNGDWLPPMTPGTVWTYRVILRDANERAHTETQEVRIVRTHEKYADSAWIERRAGSEHAMEMWSRMADDEGVAFWISGANDIRGCPLMVPAPETGWRFTGHPQGLVCRFEGFRTVDTPAGVFSECALTSVDAESSPEYGGRSERRYWFARGVGLVRYAEIRNGRAFFVLELTSVRFASNASSPSPP